MITFLIYYFNKQKGEISAETKETKGVPEIEVCIIFLF